jgi:sec-independent protein translocase protein TatC
LAGVLSHSFVRKWRRVMIFLVFVFAGAAVPSPDPFSMLMLAVPAVVLVELAEVFVWLNDRRRARQPSLYDSLAAESQISPPAEDKVESERR